jgi:CubicO group peptidase (beta-lactamase class C family)
MFLGRHVLEKFRVNKQQYQLFKSGPVDTLLGIIAIALVLVCVTRLRARDGDSPVAADDSPYNSGLKTIVRQSVDLYKLRALLVQVEQNGRTIYSAALGDSMTEVPASLRMHFRNGAVAFSYISTILLELVDQKWRGVTLDSKLSEYLPELPLSSSITLRNLANMTSGYADYVYQPEVMRSLYQDPFRQWTADELIQIGTSADRMFDPGKNWGYSHTNYVILGRVLEKITGMPLDQAMCKFVFEPLGLKQTRGFSTPVIPRPALHSFSSERREALMIPPDVPFYEETTYWNPSWTTAAGAVQTTDINDVSTTIEAVGTGRLLSRASSAEQLGPRLIGFGHKQDGCDACRENTYAFNYGLGIVNIGPWITETKDFAGNSATVGYLPSHKLSVAVVTTYLASAYDDKGNGKNASIPVFAALGNALVANSIPNTSK